MPRKELARVLDGVVLEAAPVSLRAGTHAAVAADWYRELLAARGAWCGTVGLAGPGSGGNAGQHRRSGDGCPDAGGYGGLQHAPSADVPGVGAPASDAGASEAQEIGYVLRSAFCICGPHRRRVDNPASRITLEVTGDVDVFATVAKIRALRHCWATVLENMGQPIDSTQIVAVSAHRWLTQADPWVNILRGTAATLGAVVGGADTVTLAPFDSATSCLGISGRRMARNTQLVLQDESGIGRVLDPAGGSWYIEAFTDELAAAAWKFFQRIEAADGPVDAADEIGTDIAVVAARRDKDIATRKRPITGVSEFPLLDERAPKRRPRLRRTTVRRYPRPGRRTRRRRGTAPTRTALRGPARQRR